MNFEKYSDVLAQSEFCHASSEKKDQSSIFEAQDKLILAMKNLGADISGWKIVEDDTGLLLSPIFDFQVFGTNNAQIKKSDILGIEIELCFPFHVPDIKSASHESLEEQIEKQIPCVSVEVIRPQINLKSHPGCDFYFNYGIIVSEKTIVDGFSFTVGNDSEKYDFTLVGNDLCSEKRALLKFAVFECIRRGYTGKEYFFMTGNLNGLISPDICSGKNIAFDKQGENFTFDVV